MFALNRLVGRGSAMGCQLALSALWLFAACDGTDPDCAVGASRSDGGTCVCPEGTLWSSNKAKCEPLSSDLGAARPDGGGLDSGIKGLGVDAALAPPSAPESSVIEESRDASGGSEVNNDASGLTGTANDAATAEPSGSESDDAAAAGDAASQLDPEPTCVPSTEVCNGKDDDCDQKVDEDVSAAPIGTACSNGGQGVCLQFGKQACVGGAIVCQTPPAPLPAAERCDGRDNDCDGQADEDVSEAPLGESCSNGGQSVCAMMGQQICFDGAPKCNAPPPTPQPEICDGVDNDCNGKVDDTFADKGKACTAGTGDCEGTGVFECDPADPTKLRCTAVAKKPVCGSSCAPLSTATCTEGTGDCVGTGSWVCDEATGAPKCNAVAKPVTLCCTPTGFEKCDGIDNNCDGVIDNIGWRKDCDNDGYALATSDTVGGCTAPATGPDGCVWRSQPFADDCDDTNPNVGKFCTPIRR